MPLNNVGHCWVMNSIVSVPCGGQGLLLVLGGGGPTADSVVGASVCVLAGIPVVLEEHLQAKSASRDSPPTPQILAGTHTEKCRLDGVYDLESKDSNVISSPCFYSNLANRVDGRSSIGLKEGVDGSHLGQWHAWEVFCLFGVAGCC